MWPTEFPEDRYIHVKERQDQFRAEAESNRAVPRESGPRWCRIDGRRFQVGSFLIVVGRALCDDDERLPRPAH